MYYNLRDGERNEKKSRLGVRENVSINFHAFMLMMPYHDDVYFKPLHPSRATNPVYHFCALERYEILFYCAALYGFGNVDGGAAKDGIV